MEYFIQHLIGVSIHLRWFLKLLAVTIVLAAVIYALGFVVEYYVTVPVAIIVFITILLRYFISKEEVALINKILFK